MVRNNFEEEKFKQEARILLNRCQCDSYCDMPDFVIAEYLVDCINTLHKGVEKTEKLGYLKSSFDLYE